MGFVVGDSGEGGRGEDVAFEGFGGRWWAVDYEGCLGYGALRVERRGLVSFVGGLIEGTLNVRKVMKMEMSTSKNGFMEREYCRVQRNLEGTWK